MRKITIDLNSISNYAVCDNTIRQGENLATEVEFILSSEFIGYKYLMIFQLNNKTPVLTPEIIPVGDKVSYVITNAVTSESGTLRVELHAYDDTGTLIKTVYVNLKVAQSLNGNTEVMPESYVPWYIETLKQVDIATQQAEIATQKVDEISTLNVNLETNITNANLINETLTNAETGTIKQATDINTELESTIVDAGTAKNDLQGAIDDSQIGNLSELTTQDKTNLVKAINENVTEVTEHKIATMPHQFTNLKTGKKYRYGYQISIGGIPQIIFEEVI